MNLFKKKIAVFAIFLVLVGHLAPYSVMAQEATETPTPTPEQTTEQTTETQTDSTLTPTPETSISTTETLTETPTPTPVTDIDIDNGAVVEDNINSTGVSGDNIVTEPTPTPTPIDGNLGIEGTSAENTETTENTQEAGLGTEQPSNEGTNDSTTENPEVGGLSTEQQSNQETGEQTGNEPPVCTEKQSDTQASTGDALAVTEVENSVNTTEVGSEVIFKTLNIFVSEGLSLSIDPQAILNKVVYDNPEGDEISVSVVDVNNFVYVKNEILNSALSGDNNVDGAGNVLVTTGDAYSIVSLLNKVNTTIAGSKLYLFTINIFGAVEGDIILPEYGGSNSEECCGGVTNIDNGAKVVNNVDSQAVSGDNNIVASASENQFILQTGDAKSVVNVVNFVNSTYINQIFHYLIINNLGFWNGNFLGFGEGGGGLYDGSSCFGCDGDLDVNNRALVENNVYSGVTSGDNNVQGSNNINAQTGKAYSAVSIFNFVNSTFRNSIGVFGFLNIFGKLKGDVGGASKFVEEAPTETVIEETSNEENLGEDKPFEHELGGKLEVSQSNNVGNHVFPGDVVTFFLKVKNSGTGKVYGAVLSLHLINEKGQDVGGGIFRLGDIKQGEGFKITTGLQLKKDSKAGNYTARAYVEGLVGPGDSITNAYADSFFKIVSKYIMAPAVVDKAQAAPVLPEVLGETISQAGMTTEEKLKLLLYALLAAYLPLKGYKNRREILLALEKLNGLMLEKGAAFRNFMSSFFS